MCSVFIYCNISLNHRCDLGNLFRRSGEDRLQLKTLEQNDTFLDALAIHLAECFIQNNQPDGVVSSFFILPLLRILQTWENDASSAI